MAVVQALVLEAARVLGLGLVLHQVHPLLPRAPVLGRAGRLAQGPKQAPMLGRAGRRVQGPKQAPKLGLELGRDQALDMGRVTGQETGMENDEEVISTMLMKTKKKKYREKKKTNKKLCIAIVWLSVFTSCTSMHKVDVSWKYMSVTRFPFV